MTTTTKTTKINPWYAKYATEHLVIDMDNSGLYCEVISESDENTTYTVRVDESGIAPVATACNCKSSKPCKHMKIVSNFYKRIYKSNIAKHEAKQAEQEHKSQVVATTAPSDVHLKQDLARLASSLNKQPAISAPMLGTNVGMLGSLNVSRGFSLMR